MANPGSSGVKIFRPSAARLFLFYVGLGWPLVVGICLVRYGTSFFQWREMLFGGLPVIPSSLIAAGIFSIIVAGIMSLLFPVRLTAEGIHAHSVWGFPRFIRWQDIQSARKFNFFILPWLRLYPSDGSTVIWLILFPSGPARFKLEIQKLAPPGNPILSHLK